LLLAVARQLEDAASDCQDPSLLVAGDEPGRGRGVVVVHQFEEEAEAAVMTCDRFIAQPLDRIDVDRPFLAVRTDEVGHVPRVRTSVRLLLRPAGLRAPRPDVPSARPGSARRRGRPYSLTRR